MKRELFYTLVMVTLLIPGLVLLTGCGTTGQSVKGEQQVDDSADIDELLGLSDTGAGAKDDEQDAIAEDDVLKLLGVSEEGEAGAVTKDKAQLQKELKNLEMENQAAADREQTLRDQVQQQEKTLSGIQSGEAGGRTADRVSPDYKGDTFAEQYQEALGEYRTRQYRTAIQKFEALLGTNTRHSLSDNCQYWIGESYWGMGNYQQAAVAFEKVFTFPKSNKDEAAQLKLGMCYLKLNDKEKARIEFQKLVDNYPTSEYVSLAKRFLSQLSGST